jgi:pilus assembly protein Flp/PilA
MRALSSFPLKFLPGAPIYRVQVKDADPRRGFMLALWNKVVSWVQEEKGASMVEYALLVVLIAIVALVAVQLAGNEVSSTFSEIGSGLS